MPKKKTTKKKTSQAKNGSAKRTRKARPYPVASLEDSLELGNAITRIASGEKVRRLTLLEKMEKSATSSSTKMMITNSGKYGITKGSYAAEWLELTAEGKTICDSSKPQGVRLKSSFDLAINGIAPFSRLYEEYSGKRIPAKEVMRDVLKEGDFDIEDFDECIDLFVVNAKYLQLLRTIGGAETLISIEQAIDDLKDGSGATHQIDTSDHPGGEQEISDDIPDWDKTCFYITPIGEEGSETRKHADLFLSSIVEPAVAELGLELVRADHISEPGMINTQILEHLRKCKLAIVDLSHLNPNVFYEMALRHAKKLPTVPIIRSADRLPFDVNQVRTIQIDTTDIYTLIPQLETYRSEIATQARKALADPESVGNPVSIFFPAYYN